MSDCQRSTNVVQVSQLQTSNAQDEQLISPASKRKNCNVERRNKSNVWSHMEKNIEAKKIVCKFGDCSKVYSISTGNATLYDHLEKVHNLKKCPTNETASDDSEPVVSPKIIRKGLSDHRFIFEFYYFQ